VSAGESRFARFCRLLLDDYLTMSDLRARAHVDPALWPDGTDSVPRDGAG